MQLQSIKSRIRDNLLILRAELEFLLAGLAAVKLDQHGLESLQVIQEIEPALARGDDQAPINGGPPA